jgi:hypothetical protein
MLQSACVTAAGSRLVSQGSVIGPTDLPPQPRKERSAEEATNQLVLGAPCHPLRIARAYGLDVIDSAGEPVERAR